MNVNIDIARELLDFYDSENQSQEILEFIKWVIEEASMWPNECGSSSTIDDDGNCVDDPNPLLGADCRSFEYAQPPGASMKACGVENLGNNFYFAYIDNNGSPVVGFFDSNFPLIYFTMPPGMTNGRAANLTARAVTNATRITDTYVIANAADLTEADVRNYFETTIRTAMSFFGGDITQTPPFTIPSPALYMTSFFGAKTDCD